MRAGRRAAAVGAAAAAAVTLSGCQGIYDVPLPGGAARSHSYHVTVQFDDVLDLVPQSAVKVDDVTVGAVEKVRLDGWHAVVRLRVADSVKLPDNAVAELRQTSLLGEKFVELAPPTGTAPVGRLSDGDVIPLARTTRGTQVEEVLSALSLLLNGGGVAQLKTITVELNKAMSGREGDLRDLLAQLDTFVGNLDANKAQIVKALDSIDRLSATLATQKKDIATALDSIPQGLKVLADQRQQLTSMLVELDRLGQVGTRVIRESTADTVADLKDLQPILTKLAQAGDSLPKSLELLFTYPFPRNAVDGGIQGDYANLSATLDLNLNDLISNLRQGGLPQPPTLPGLPSLPVPTTLPSLPLPTALPTVPTVPLPSLPVVGCPTALAGVNLPVGCPTPTSSAGSSPTSSTGGTCVLGLCLGEAATSYDPSLAAMMTGGYA
ncbi:MAG: MCE family protein [Motilibacteraceae bacterium]